MSIAVLSIVGAVLAAGAALGARALGRRAASPAAMAVAATVGLAAVAALPFVWVRMFGR